MDMEELVKIIGPLLGLLILGLMVWKMFQLDDAGKQITGMIQSRKLIIADLFLVGLAFLEGLVAANMGDDSMGDSYTTRFTSHFVLSMVGAYSGFICIKELMDFAQKLKEKHTFIYMFVQFLQPLLYFIIAGVMPVFNLIIISKGAGSYDILSYLWPIYSPQYPFSEIFGALDDVTARSLLMVGVHILLTGAVALGSIDDVEEPKEKKDKSDKKDEDEDEDEPEDAKKDKKEIKLSIADSLKIVADASDKRTDVISLTVDLWQPAIERSNYKDQLKGRLANLAGNIKRIDNLMNVKSGDQKAIEDLKVQKTKHERNVQKFLSDLENK
jgi:hypothetical protein